MKDEKKERPPQDTKDKGNRPSQDVGEVVGRIMTKGGALDLLKVGKHSWEGPGGARRPCDVRSGPCGCGAWH